MNEQAAPRYTSFDGERRIASGTVRAVALATKEVLDGGATGRIMIFDDASGDAVELDFRGTPEEVAERIDMGQVAVGRVDKAADAGEGSPPRRGPGRPRLGVVPKEVTLLPRHWAWLGAQRGGASAALRRLVDETRRTSAREDRARQAQDSAYRFMWAMTGDQPGFEEAMRALYASDEVRFDAETEGWPRDLRDYSRTLAVGAFAAPPTEENEGS